MRPPMFKYSCQVLAVVALSSCFAVRALSQTNTADILGTVIDSSGAVIPGAAITVVNVGTGESRSVKSGPSGEYALSSLEIGTYSVQVEFVGFKTFRVPSLTVAAGDRDRVEARLEPGNLNEVVNVLAGSPALQTDNSTVGSLIDNAQVDNLPLNGRNFINLVTVQAGVNPGLAGSFSSGLKPDDRRQTSTYSANGQTDQANNNLIDGLDNNQRKSGTIGVRPSPDAIQEIRVETGLYTAEVGRSAGGVVDLITKSGTNKFHGSLYEFFRNDVLDARDYFSVGTRKPELRQNQYGGSIGGPIFRGKTFFFGDYEGFRQIIGQTIVSTVPTLFERQSCNATAGCNFSDVPVTLRNGTQVPGPIIPASAINPIGLAYFNLYPLPNVGNGAVNNFSYSPNRTQYSTLFDVRIDHQFTSKTTLFGRYTFNDVNTVSPPVLPTINGIQPGGGTFTFIGPSAERLMHTGFALTHTFSSNLLVDLKAGYLRAVDVTLPANSGTQAAGFGFTNVNITAIPATLGLPSFTIAGYASLGDSNFVPLRELENSFQYLSDVVYTRGTHSLRFGGGVIRRQVFPDQSQSPRGGGFILGVFSGSSIGDLVSGQATSIQRNTTLQSPSLRTWEPSAYFQDDWRATKRLTLNLGVRYDVFTPYTAHNNAITNFDFTKNLIVGPLLPGVNKSSDTAGVNTDYSNLSPRLGFALDLGHKLAVHGGFGISFFPDNYTSQNLLKNAPYTATFHCGIITDTTPCTGVYGGFAGNYRLGTLPAPVVDLTNATNPANYAGTALNAILANTRTSYVQQYSLAVQKEIAGNVLGIAYVGNLGRHIEAAPNLNQAPYPGAAKPIPSLPTTIIGTTVSGGVSAYNALQLTLERRLYKGLSGNANYTLAHNLGNISTNGEAAANIQNGDRYSCVGPCHINIPGTSGYTIGNSWESYDYGNSEIDVRDRVAVTLSYAIQYGQSFTGLRGVALKGWQVSTLFFYQNGLPFTVENSSPVGGTSDGSTNSSDRPNVAGNAKLSHPTLAQYFNVAAFTTQATGTLGDEGKNPYYAPRFTALNFSLFKTFALSEHTTLEFRAESFNLTNTPSFNPPANLFGAVNFGTTSSTIPGATPRQLQFALKLLF